MKVKSEKKQSVLRQGVKKQTKHSAVNKAVKNVKKQLSTVPKKKLAKLHEPIKADVPTKALVKLNRGVVYIGHIPHGFYEKQMQGYFEQFGKVTRVRVARSKKTGGSKGYGFVEFENCDVAQIAAQSMNNYLMSGRLLKASYIPPEKQHTGYFVGENWSKTNNPNLKNRKKQTAGLNTNVDHKIGNILEEKILNTIAEMERKLADKGIIYKIKPVGGSIVN